MRIAFDAKRAFANSRGLGNYSRDVFRLLSSFYPENEYVLCGVNKKGLCPNFPHTQELTPKGLWNFCPSLWRTVGVPSSLNNIDIYHGLSGEIPIGISSKVAHTVVTIHDAIFLRYPELYSATYRILFTQKVRYACTHSRLIIAISEQTKRDIIDFFHIDEKKIKVVYQGCNNIFRTDAHSSIPSVREKYNLPEQYILTVGAIEERKNLQSLIRAVASSHIALPILAVGGRTPYTDESEQLAAKLGVTLLICDHAEFTDFPAIYQGASVFVYPSLFEGFGIPILEALCSGVPVVTSKGSCFAETAGDAALYASPIYPDEIGHQIKTILENPSLAAELIAKGKQQADKFTDDKVAANLMATYQSVIAND